MSLPPPKPRAATICSGIGGLDLGLERAGWDIAWQCEIDEWRSEILAAHWPDVPNLGDVTLVDWSAVEHVVLLAASYPCQPFSYAGNRKGTDDVRHLWPWVRDAINALRPPIVLLENVPGHVSLGLGRVLGDLVELGYDAEWQVVPACTVGASHARARLFVVAYPAGSDVAGALSSDPRQGPWAGLQWGPESRGSGSAESRPGRWLPEPPVDRMADGLPRRVVRPALEALGDAVVPQAAELIGKIVAARVPLPLNPTQKT